MKDPNQKHTRFASIASSSLGNILEWYDFGLFTIFSSLFSRLFFPSEDPKLAILATISIFSIGFFCRPIGALLFGYLGDRYGRVLTLRLSILMIALPTLFVGCLPTYQQIGILAPLLLVLVRMWQGISIGGEYSGNLIYLAESAPKAYRATFTSFASIGSNLGILLATLVGSFTTFLFSESFLESWGWRIPYLLSGLICLLVYLFRLRLIETNVFKHLKQENLTPRHPIKTVFERNYSQILLTLGLVCMGSTFYYFAFVYLPIFLTQENHFSIKNISLLMSAALIFLILIVPCAGFICDKVGRRKMLLFNAAFIILTIIPGFYLLQSGNYLFLLLTFGIFSLGSALEQGTTPISLIENFPAPTRYTGVSFGYNIGNGFLGGTVPMICAWLVNLTNQPLVAAIYVTGCALITFFVIIFFIKETKGKSLLC